MLRSLIIWIVIAVILASIFSNKNFNFGTQQNNRSLDYSEFVRQVQDNRVQQVTFDTYMIFGRLNDGTEFETIRPAAQDPGLMDSLLNHNVQVKGKQPEQPSLWRQLLVASFPILLILAIFMFSMNRMQGAMGGRDPMSFGRSRAKKLSEGDIKVTFKDVAGVDEAKEDVYELVEFLTEPDKFTKLGGRIPKGILLVGPPGTGKTLLAKAIAGEAKVPFFSISGSDFVEMFVGVGAARVRGMFTQAKKSAPCIIFIDELDAVGRRRGAGLGGGHDEREQTLNQMLVEMDGFDGKEGVIVLAATNRPDVLDPALLRPGRFDRQVVVNLPDIKGREEILAVHIKKLPLAKDIVLSTLAKATPGFSGADLANLVNEASLFAARSNRSTVSMHEFEKAKDKILMGAERRSMIMTEEEKRNTAYHEAGHAIVGRLMPEHDPVYKVTIIPRGRALGVTMFLPERDKYSHSKQYLLSSITSLFGGRVAEELTLGEIGITTGASNDIERATNMARNMVTKWGLSTMGPLRYDEEEQEVFLGRSMSQTARHLSPETLRDIDGEVRKIVNQCYQKAKNLLQENMEKLHMMAEALIKYETIELSQINDIMKGKAPRSPARRKARTTRRKPRTKTTDANQPLSKEPLDKQNDEKRA